MHAPSLLLLLAFGFGFALIFGLMTNRIGLSPIAGYLLAGLAIGPWTPGFTADTYLAHQLAEVGVILLMFGVGLHFKVRELVRVANIAVPGAVVQSGVAIGLAMLLVPLFGLSIRYALVLGAAVSVASTVVLLRMLIDRGDLHTPEGHVAVGWLIVEDLFTVGALVLLPAVAAAVSGEGLSAVVKPLLMAVFQVLAALAIILVLGKRFLPWFMNLVARTRSRELFTLTVLVVAISIAVASAEIFGVSMALGAFLAGLVVAQSDVGEQAGAGAVPFRDAFAVLFFVSVGMLLNPQVLWTSPVLSLAVLFIVMIGKPLAAFAIVIILNHPLRTALTVAVGLGQIGEFSFILAAVARQFDFIDAELTSILVLAAIVSITANPILFRLLPRMEKLVVSIPRIGNYMRQRGSTDSFNRLSHPGEKLAGGGAIVVGYGPVGQAVIKGLVAASIPTTIVDLNVDTVMRLREQGSTALFGDSQDPELLEAAGIADARLLVLTVPDPTARSITVTMARQLNPDIEILARTRYVSESDGLQQTGVTGIICEETEVAEKLVDLVVGHFRPAPLG